MVTSKMLLAVILMLASLVLASANEEDSASSSESPIKKKDIDKDSTIMYHLLEGKKHKQEPEPYIHHDHPDWKKVNFVTSYPKDYVNKPNTEGVRYVSIIPNPHYLPSPYVTDTQMHYQSTTPSSLSTPPAYIPHKPHHKLCPCRCDAMSNYKTLSTALKNQLSEMPYDIEQVTQQTTYYEEIPQNTYRRKESPRKKVMACGDRKLRKVKHVIIRKHDSPRDKKDVDDMLMEKQ